MVLLEPMRYRPWVVLWLVLSVAACTHVTGQAPAPAPSPPAAATARALRLASEPMAFHMRDVDYLQVDGKTFQATIYQPEGRGPFPALLDVHGGAWVREDVRHDEHALMDQALAAMGVVVVAIDFRQSAHDHYPDSVAEVNTITFCSNAHAGPIELGELSIQALENPADHRPHQAQ